MSRVRSFLLVACAAFFLATIASAQQSPQVQRAAFPRVTIAGSELRTMRSTSTGRDYDIYVHLPSTYDKDKVKKYPVLYILDAQWDFKLMDSVLGGLVYDEFMPEIIMVGITYSGENPDYNALRATDLTPTFTGPGSGEAPKFLNFMQNELVPFIESSYRADPHHRVLQGSSFGGLFTIYAMFSNPQFFSAYIAASPAVTYDNGVGFRIEEQYAKNHKELPAKLYLGVGGAEGLAQPVQQFMQTLKAHNYKGLKLETHVFDGERHSSNKPELYNRGLRYVFTN
jgi:predicted alpha/beta superfamily hydrolase